MPRDLTVSLFSRHCNNVILIPGRDELRRKPDQAPVEGPFEGRDGHEAKDEEEEKPDDDEVRQLRNGLVEILEDF